MHRVDAVGNSLGVRRELAEGIESLLGWRKGVHQKKTETRLKIIRDSRKACWEANYDRSNGVTTRWWTKIKLEHQAGVLTMRWDFTGSSLEDSSKGSGSSLGIRREITGRRP
ncbi:hypothetical protein B296_00053608 [Ensete ventricosum]|uniref:Uncharacterized protein n=1 Tax=Ensete ventricosum TaxID=4639 RepID=A0A426WWK4_ENSVE|nr:hypothetical protein B296_00053608 [Ensete ventricosum]